MQTDKDGVCEICGKADETCTFENACSCWYDTPCKPLIFKCECADPGCPVHKGISECNKRSATRDESILYRVDMEDRSGTLFCEGCWQDAAGSGLFVSGEERGDWEMV